MFHITRQDHLNKENTIIFSGENLFEIRQQLETTVFDFLTSKIGEKAIEKRTDHIEHSTSRKYKDDHVVGIESRFVPRCLHRLYAQGSKSWNKIVDEYFVIRDTQESLYKMIICKKKSDAGWLSSFDYQKLYSFDIIYQGIIDCDYDVFAIELDETGDDTERFERVFLEVLEQLKERFESPKVPVPLPPIPSAATL